MGYRTQYFTYLWRHRCLSLRTHHGGKCAKPSNSSDKIKMTENTTGWRIKSFIPAENINVEKLRDILSNLTISSRVSLKWIQKSSSLLSLLRPTLMFSFLWWFLQTSYNNKRQLDWQLKYLSFDRKVLHTLNLIYIIKFDNCSGNAWAGGFSSAWSTAWLNAGNW